MAASIFSGAAASRVVAALLSFHAALTKAAAALRRVSALTSSAGPTPTATMVEPSSAGSDAVSPTLPSKLRSASQAQSRAAPAPGGDVRPAKTGTPSTWVSSGAASVRVTAIVMGLQ